MITLIHADGEGNNSWPELLNFMFSAANSDNLELRECALLLFNSLPSIFGNEQNKYLDFIKKMLLKSLCDESNEAVCFYFTLVYFNLTMHA